MCVVYQRIKNLREDKDWTQREMAEMLHISRSAYSAYENGTNAFPVEILKSLAILYHTSVDYLLEMTDNPNLYERKK
jgi:transcriptional regulator with XRE-family HTH domain